MKFKYYLISIIFTLTIGCDQIKKYNECKNDGLIFKHFYLGMSNHSYQDSLSKLSKIGILKKGNYLIEAGNEVYELKILPEFDNNFGLIKITFSEEKKKRNQALWELVLTKYSTSNLESLKYSLLSFQKVNNESNLGGAGSVPYNSAHYQKKIFFQNNCNQIDLNIEAFINKEETIEKLDVIGANFDEDFAKTIQRIKQKESDENVDTDLFLNDSSFKISFESTRLQKMKHDSVSKNEEITNRNIELLQKKRKIKQQEQL